MNKSAPSAIDAAPPPMPRSTVKVVAVASAVQRITSFVAALTTIVPPTANNTSLPASTVIVVAEFDKAPFTVSVRAGSSSRKFLNSLSSVASEEVIANKAFRGALPFGSKSVKSSR